MISRDTGPEGKPGYSYRNVEGGREGEKILSFTRDPRANPVAKAGSLSPFKLMEY